MNSVMSAGINESRKGEVTTPFSPFLCPPLPASLLFSHSCSLAPPTPLLFHVFGVPPCFATLLLPDPHWRILFLAIRCDRLYQMAIDRPEKRRGGFSVLGAANGADRQWGAFTSPPATHPSTLSSLLHSLSSFLSSLSFHSSLLFYVLFFPPAEQAEDGRLSVPRLGWEEQWFLNRYGITVQT